MLILPTLTVVFVFYVLRSPSSTPAHAMVPVYLHEVLLQLGLGVVLLVAQTTREPDLSATKSFPLISVSDRYIIAFKKIRHGSG